MVLEDITEIESSPLKLRDRPAPQTGRGEVRLRVAACGICRTDLPVSNR